LSALTSASPDGRGCIRILRDAVKGEEPMKKILVVALAALLVATPLAAEAQQKKKKQQDDQNPLTLLIGIFSTINCIITCAGTTKTIVTTVFVPQQEQFVTTSTTTSKYGAYLGGALACTFLWPFINHFAGGKEPTSEEALMNTVSCWVPGLGILLYLQNQYAP
jgi:hypothetical protein